MGKKSTEFGAYWDQPRLKKVLGNQQRKFHDKSRLAPFDLRDILAGNGISEKVKNYIFTNIDSVELLEILMVFHKDETKSWTVQSLAVELRSNPNSVVKRVQFLQSIELLKETCEASAEYFYHPPNPEVHEIVTELATAHRVQRHYVYELIFSPMKKARDFADAFRRQGGGKDRRGDG